ncbi:SLC13 family permease [Desulfotignum phosphitoxidans]|uniref:Citrate transporter n=1 Tax=Desulfotignum phosphitoxidans DSM 13687 TaxID=1286635 RepID=S0FZK5_9BACT|nr:SLC13 family permease [Desulfotignum phosphitoxidans]EMS77397.1 citrate transporter [Desulfotignum phosphitoxidans DSM 13687]
MPADLLTFLSPGMTWNMLVVYGFLIGVILLFAFDLVRVDMVGLLVMVLLPLSGLVTPGQAISGLSSNAVVSIIAVMIIGHGLDKTGVMNQVAAQIIKLSGKSRNRMMTLVAGTVAVISGFMQNIGAAALFLPAVNRMCRQLNVPISQVLIPMGYAAVIGGCITLVGSSPLILLNDLAGSWWHANPELVAHQPYSPFSLFFVAPMGIALVVAALVYFIFLGRWVLPRSEPMADACNLLNHDLECTYGREVSKVFELAVPGNFFTRRLEELELRPKYHATVVCISKRNGRYRVTEPGRADVIEPFDVIGIVANEEHARNLADDLGWTLRSELNDLSGVLSMDNAGITEAIVTPRSELVGKTFHEYGFRKKLRVNPLALYRQNQLILENISEIKIQPGDAVLLHGEWEKLHLLKQKPILAFTEHLKGEILYPENALRALSCLVLALVLALGFNIQLSISLLAGAVGMVLTRVMTLDQAYRSVDWMTVFLLAGLIPLGIAFENTGAAGFLATSLTHMLHDFLTPVTLFLLVGALTSAFTLFVSNIGATVLMIPLAMNMAVQCQADPRMAAMLVAIAASNTFILPTHQVNALIMRPGGYRVKDYVRAGTGMTLIFMAVVMIMFWAVYGMAA